MTAKNIVLVLVTLFGFFAAGQLMAQYNATLFQQQYTQPGGSQIQAGLYPAPHPVPYQVGHTYYTYEPLYPHEHLYVHSRIYLKFDDCYDYYGGGHGKKCHGGHCGGGGGGGPALNKTTVIWQNGCQHYGQFPFSFTGLQRLHYKWNIKHWGKYHGAGGCAGGDCGGGGIITR